MMKKKIVHLCASYTPNIGGVEKHLFLLNSELLKRKYSVSVITQLHDSSLKKSENINGVTVYRIANLQKKTQSFINKTKYKLGIWSGIFRLFPLLKSADIIHIHDVFFWLIPFLPLLSRKKLFITFHGYEGSDAPGIKQVFWHKCANLFTNRNICIGGFHKKWYGITPDSTSFGAVQLSLNEKTKKTDKLIYIGRLHDDTGIMEYLQGLQQLKKGGHNFELDVFGSGPLLQKAQTFSQRNSLKVNFYGFTKNAAQHLSAYKLAYVSRYLTVLEAISVGTPVVAHYNNQIKNDYLSISPFSEWIAIAQTPEEIFEFTNNPKKLPKKAREWAREQTWEKLADVYEKTWGI